MWDRCTTLSFTVCVCARQQYLAVCMCSYSTVHLLYHLFMAAISLHWSPVELLLPPLFTHSLHLCTPSQTAKTFLPSSLLVPGDPPPSLPSFLLFPSFILQWPLCPVLLKLRLSFIYPSLYLPEESQFLSPFTSLCMLLFSPLTQPWVCCGRCTWWVSGENICVCTVCVCVGMLEY